MTGGNVGVVLYVPSFPAFFDVVDWLRRTHWTHIHLLLHEKQCHSVCLFSSQMASIVVPYFVMQIPQ